MRTITVSLASLLTLAGCGGGGMSTEEVREAAIERARAELGVSAEAPLEANVWTGGEYDGDVVVCGTVSDRSAGASAVPQRFAASTDPFRWLVFEGAHDPMVTPQPDKFPEWTTLCGQGQQG